MKYSFEKSSLRGYNSLSLETKTAVTMSAQLHSHQNHAECFAKSVSIAGIPCVVALGTDTDILHLGVY
jgi:hypothetical protein